MDKLVVRSYRLGDESEIVNLWNLSLPKDRISQSVFDRKVLCDPNFSPETCLVATCQDQVVGFLLCLMRRVSLDGNDLEEENAWITVFFVHPERRREKIGTALLDKALEVCRKKGRKRVLFASYAPNYFLPGIDQETYPEAASFLEGHGFVKQYSPVAMDRNLLFFHYPEDVSEVERLRQLEGYSFQYLESKYISQLLAFASAEFNPDWGRALRDALVHGLPYEQILIVAKSDRVCGFCMYGGYDGIKERFGPFGVCQSKRGLGLGKVLLYRCLADMSANGLHTAWFLWTGEQLPAGKLYHRAGFETTRRFTVMAKELEEI